MNILLLCLHQGPLRPVENSNTSHWGGRSLLHQGSSPLSSLVPPWGPSLRIIPCIILQYWDGTQGLNHAKHMLYPASCTLSSETSFLLRLNNIAAYGITVKSFVVWGCSSAAECLLPRQNKNKQLKITPLKSLNPQKMEDPGLYSHPSCSLKTFLFF